MSHIRKCAAIGLLLALGGCGMSSGIAALSYTMTGVSYASSGKGVADHALSAAVEQDCAVLRAVQGNDICRTEQRDAGDLMTMIDPGGTPERGPQTVSLSAPTVAGGASGEKATSMSSSAAVGNTVRLASPLESIYGKAR